MKKYLKNALKKIKAIQKSDLTIYDEIEIGSKLYWLTSQELQAILNDKLVGLNLIGLPLRTRSKKVKSEICNALGYPIPSSFKKTQPRFLCNTGRHFQSVAQY